MKERFYPNYVDVYRLCGNCVTIHRRCIDGITRYINTIRFKTNKVCSAYFDSI